MDSYSAGSRLILASIKRKCKAHQQDSRTLKMSLLGRRTEQNPRRSAEARSPGGDRRETMEPMEWAAA